MRDLSPKTKFWWMSNKRIVLSTTRNLQKVIQGNEEGWRALNSIEVACRAGSNCRYVTRQSKQGGRHRPGANAHVHAINKRWSSCGQMSFLHWFAICLHEECRNNFPSQFISSAWNSFAITSYWLTEGVRENSDLHWPIMWAFFIEQPRHVLTSL